MILLPVFHSPGVGLTVHAGFKNMRESIESSTNTITAKEACQYLRVNIADDDARAVIARLIAAAVDFVERETGYVFGEKEIELTINQFDQPENGWFRLAHAPVGDDLAVEIDGAEADFDRREVGDVTEIRIPSRGSDDVLVTYTAGDEPPSLRQAILTLAGNSYEHRESTVTGTIISEVPHGVDRILEQFRIYKRVS